MKFALLAQALLFAGALSQQVYDLDNPEEVAALESEGLLLAGVGAEESLKVASSSPTSAYSWIIDRDNCRGIVDITSGFVAPAASDDGLSVDFGEEVFTVSALAPGDCTFQIAYAVPRDFVSFEDYRNVNGLIISFPIKVGDDAQDLEAKIVCNSEVENCALKNQYGITTKVEKHFSWMGTQAWMRAFTTPGGLAVWLPQAITWQRAKNGSVRAAERFLWITKWWAQIAGWLFFPASIAALGVAIGDGDRDGDKKMLMSPLVEKKRRRGDDDEEGNQISLIVGASVILSLDIAGWTLFYLSYKDAINYGQYLLESNIQASEDSLADAGF